jgi:hypothetical protein
MKSRGFQANIEDCPNKAFQRYFRSILQKAEGEFGYGYSSTLVHVSIEVLPVRVGFWNANGHFQHVTAFKCTLLANRFRHLYTVTPFQTPLELDVLSQNHMLH